MSGLFRRKKDKKTSTGDEDDGDSYLDLITKKVNDSNGNFFGEVVSADEDFFIIKHKGSFYRFATENVGNKFGDLMLTQNIDLDLAKNQGDQWKNMGKEIIGENKVYDFSEKKRLEQEREDRIHREMEMVRELALHTNITEESNEEEDEEEENEEPEDEEEGDEEEVEEERVEEKTEDNEEASINDESPADDELDGDNAEERDDTQGGDDAEEREDVDDEEHAGADNDVNDEDDPVEGDDDVVDDAEEEEKKELSVGE